MQQVFETFFVHVDPHPGNLFVKPLIDNKERGEGKPEFKPGDAVPFKNGRSFQLVFIDFGMMASIPERLRMALRLYAIGIGTQDPSKIVQAYVDAGALPADADLIRIEEAHRDLFRRLWGVRVGQFKDLALKEARYFIKQYRDVIYDAPFQFQVDMLFVVRAVGILSGLATYLDPQFDPWEKTVPYAERFAKANLWEDWQGLPREFQILIHAARHMPGRLDRLLSKAIEGRISVDADISDEKMNVLVSSIRRVGWAIIASALAVCGAVIQSSGNENSPWWFYLPAVIFFANALKKP
jgi:predicted unusual protein kinase regulating ubiquinone biosynthesis (AarF/ABC1/UbiB family)